MSRKAGAGDDRQWSAGSLLLRLPFDAVAWVAGAYVWLLHPMNWAYPLRTDTDPQSLADSWGGPTLAGAWIVHALGGTLAFLILGLPVMNGVTWLLARVRLPTRSSARPSPSAQRGQARAAP